MTRKYFLGLDVGTSGCKAVVFDEKGRIEGYGFSEYPIICDAPHKAEQDAERVFEKLNDVTKQAILKSGKREIEALSVSVQGDATMPVGDGFKPLHHMVLGMDYRSQPECDIFEREIGGKAVFLKTGMPNHPINTAAKILWFKNNAPEAFDAAKWFMTYSDYITAKLCGEAVMDLTMASRSMMLDIRTQEWDEAVLQVCGIGADKLSGLTPSGSAVGKLSDTLKIEWGLKNNPVVVTGGHDQTCGAIGAGMIKPGIAVDSSGTAEVFSTTFAEPLLSDDMLNASYPCYSHAVAGLYFTFALNHTAGIVLRWYRDNLADFEKQHAEANGVDVYAYIQRNIKNVPSDVLVLPHFNGSGTPTCDVNAKGAILGLTLATTKDDLFKGLLDGLTYELRTNLETMERAGIQINEIRAVGGGAKSDLWMRTKADVINRPITTLQCKESGCLGAAVLAAVGCGYYRSIAEAAGQMVYTDKVFEPDEKNHQRYVEKYAVYKDIYQSIRGINNRF